MMRLQTVADPFQLKLRPNAVVAIQPPSIIGAAEVPTRERISSPHDDDRPLDRMNCIHPKDLPTVTSTVNAKNSTPVKEL
jgi:hypothetical protein